MTPASCRTFQHHAMLLRGTTCAGTSGPPPGCIVFRQCQAADGTLHRGRVSYTYGTPVCVHRPFLHTDDPGFCPCVPFLPGDSTMLLDGTIGYVPIVVWYCVSAARIATPWTRPQHCYYDYNPDQTTHNHKLHRKK